MPLWHVYRPTQDPPHQIHRRHSCNSIDSSLFSVHLLSITPTTALLKIVPEADDIKETNRRLDKISDYILEKMNATGIKCLWGTANMFSNPRFMNGAGSTNSADVYCFAAAQIKKALDITVKLGGKGYVF